MHCSSVEAYLLWKCCFKYVNIWQQNAVTLLFSWIAWYILLVILSVAENLCNKCQSGYSNKTAVIVIISMRSLVSIQQQSPRRPCDITHHSIYAILFEHYIWCICGVAIKISDHGICFWKGVPLFASVPYKGLLRYNVHVNCNRLGTYWPV